jgi:hypothetical protein
MLFGNVYYAWQASRMSRITGRKYTAQPYGVHTIAGFAYIYGIMVPVYLDQVRAAIYLSLPDSSCRGSSSSQEMLIPLTLVHTHTTVGQDGILASSRR